MKLLTTITLLSLIFTSHAQRIEEIVIFKTIKDGKVISDTVNTSERQKIGEFIQKGVPYFGPITKVPKGNPSKHTISTNGNVFRQTYVTFKYDSLGFLTEQAYYNKEDKLQAGYSDIAIYRHLNDSNGNRLETRYIGDKNQLIRVEFVGPSIVRRKFNSLGFKIEETMFDENDKPLNDFHKVIWEYSESGLIISTKRFKGNGEEIKQ